MRSVKQMIQLNRICPSIWPYSNHASNLLFASILFLSIWLG